MRPVTLFTIQWGDLPWKKCADRHRRWDMKD